MALIATPGASNANSYLTLAEFVTYLTTRPQTPAAVTAATDPQREAALIMATRMIDAYQCWSGAAASATQALMWPRTGMLTHHGFPMDSTIIPQQLKDAVSELAIAMLVSDIFADSDVSIQGITSIKAGPVALTFKDEISARGLPAFVTSLIPSSWKCESDVDENDADSFLFEVYNGE